MTTAEELRAERMKLMDDVINNREPERVPIVGSCSTWAYYYKDTSPLTAVRSNEVVKEVSRAIYTDFYWDIIDIGPVVAFHPDIFAVAGGGTLLLLRKGCTRQIRCHHGYGTGRIS